MLPKDKYQLTSNICTCASIYPWFIINKLGVTGNNYNFYWRKKKSAFTLLFLLQTDYYNYRSWLQSTLPLIQFWPSLDTELFVATGTINLKVKKSNQNIGLSKSCVPVNRITNSCPSCVTKARQLLSWPIIGHTRSRIKTATNERSRSR